MAAYGELRAKSRSVVASAAPRWFSNVRVLRLSRLARRLQSRLAPRLRAQI
jgi:hypothetical protein